MTSDTSPRILLSTRIMRGLSGKVILLRHNIKALQAAGWQVSLFAEKFDQSFLDESDVTTIRLWNKLFSKPYRLKRFLNKHRQLAIKGGFDLVVGHGETLYQDVLHVHNCRHLENELLDGRALLPGMKPTVDLQVEQIKNGCYRRLIANSQMMKDDFVKRFGADPTAIEVVYPGYDKARFIRNRENAESQVLRQKIGFRDEQVIGLVTSGKLKLRGADLLLSSVAALPAEVRSRTRTIIVAKDDFEPFRAQANQLGIGENVHFFEARPDVESIYNALDIYVNPARFETFSMTVLEAMACGIPSITVKGRVGAAEIFEGDLSQGLMSEPTPEALTPILERLLTSESAREQHGRLCSEAASQHSWASNTERHLEIYRQVLDEKHSEGAY